MAARAAQIDKAARLVLGPAHLKSDRPKDSAKMLEVQFAAELKNSRVEG
jgi:hypothetical protein